MNIIIKTKLKQEDTHVYHTRYTARRTISRETRLQPTHAVPVRLTRPVTSTSVRCGVVRVRETLDVAVGTAVPTAACAAPLVVRRAATKLWTCARGASRLNDGFDSFGWTDFFFYFLPSFFGTPCNVSI